MPTTLCHMEKQRAILPFRSGAANMTEAERVVRLVAGLVGTPLLYLLVARPLHGALEVLAVVGFVAVALDLIVSGIRGYCPFYRYVSVPWASPDASPSAPSPGNDTSSKTGASR